MDNTSIITITKQIALILEYLSVKCLVRLVTSSKRFLEGMILIVF
jgi:hypothetical protein